VLTCLVVDAASAKLLELVRASDGRLEPGRDHVAVEAPLEVRLNGHPFAVIMRTPGADTDLAAGFLFTEGVIRSAADLERVDPVDGVSVLNAVLSRSRAEILPDLLDSRRTVSQNSSCGLCGRRTLESLDIDRPPLSVEWQLDVNVIAGLPALLRHAQHAFDLTGGLHAAGLFDLHGRLLGSAEDVGRHNAVDKLLGRALVAGHLPLADAILVVSGRASFEIVQKAFLGGIPLVAAVSAPSSLAVDLSERAGITLVAFVRDDRCNVYAHPERIRPSQ
jgi:FdhD protein